MNQRSFIVLAAVVAFLVLGTVGVYAYDKSQDDTIADGVKVGGIDIGGMSKSKARTTLGHELTARLNQPLFVSWHGTRYKLSPQAARLRIDVDGIVNEALEKSREGNVLSRALRSITSGNVNANIPVKLAYSQAALNAFVKRVESGVNRPAQDAHVGYSSTSIRKVRGRNGVVVVDSKLRSEVEAALRTPNGDRTLKPAVAVTKPKVTTRDLASKYPAIILVCRSCFQLRFYKHLKLKHIYPIAVGQQGLETPAGLYDVQDKQVNPSWHVPNSAWAGSLAGRIIPPGPQDPLKARWMGFNGGAGIHGTADIGSLGTAASHGCVRMSIPDVEQLYDQVSVGSPVYVA
jgi:L,D-transpeptidase catalytic domain/Putative peptidoglycan binding domain